MAKVQRNRRTTLNKTRKSGNASERGPTAPKLARVSRALKNALHLKETTAAKVIVDAGGHTFVRIPSGVI